MDTEVVEDVTDELVKGDVRVLVAGAAIGGLLIGLAAGYELARRRLTTKYETLLQDEIAETKAFYARLNKGDGYETPEAAAETLRPEVAKAADALVSYQNGAMVLETTDEPEVVVETSVNVFTKSQSDEEFDPDVEERRRLEFPNEPFIITNEEFLENELEHNQVTLTYYAGDDTLADEKDDPIELVNEVAGEANLTRFGAGSGDNSTVFVRNNRLSLDFEIVRSDGKFAHEVLGLKHSDETFERRHRTQRFRGGDE